MRFALLLVMLAAASPAMADDGLCVDRPGLGTPACVLAAGQGMAELGLAEWDHSGDAATREDDFNFGQMLVRYGIGGNTELGLGFDGYASNRLRDRTSGLVTRSRGGGDMTLFVRHNLSGGDGPVAVHGFVTLPTGRAGIGAGDWGAGLLVPVDLTLPQGFELDLTPELDAAVNDSGKGRHFAWGGVLGLGHALGPKVGIEAEVAAWRHDDPAGAYTDARSALSLAWQPGKDWQIDVETDFGLSSAAPDHALIVGLARRF